MSKKLKNGAPGVWHPIETAPNDKDILVAYHNGQVRLIKAYDNDGEWNAPDPEFIEECKYSPGIQIPTHWMQVPAAPTSLVATEDK
jgi:hypothetical protein